MTIEQLFVYLDYAGIFMFALSGGLLAARKALDPFGAAIIGTVAGMGGGTLRDILLGSLPVYWIASPEYLAIALAGALLGYYGSVLFASETGGRRRALAWADAGGLAVFCVIGAQAGLAVGAHWSIAILTGVMSAAFGGLLRDIILNDVPLVLREEIYALAALSGAALYVAMVMLELSTGVAAISGAILAFVIRGAAMMYNWSLPPIGKL